MNTTLQALFNRLLSERIDRAVAHFLAMDDGHNKMFRLTDSRIELLEHRVNRLESALDRSTTTKE